MERLFSGRPDFASFCGKNALFSRVLAKNRGAPKTAVPTTTHPIPQLTPSEIPHRLDKMSVGQTGHFHGTNGTRPRVVAIQKRRCPANFFIFYWFFPSSPMWAEAEVHYQNSCQSRFSRMYLVFEVFQEREFVDMQHRMLVVSYLVLQACISFSRRFRQKWRTSVFALIA